MAIASVGTLGTSISSTSAATFAVVTATNALAAGDFALFEITTAPQTGAGDGVNNEHKSFSGGTGIWTKVGEFTNASGCTVSLWLFEATGTVATATTFTLTLSGAVVDKTASGWKFTKAAGTSIALDTAPTTNPITNLTDASSGFGSAAFSGLASVARLYFRALGKKANTTTALTVSTGFTAITAARSRNNASAVTSYGEFIIATATGETSNPTLAVSGDTSGIFASLIEVTTSDPTTLTDNFDDNTKDVTKWGTDAPLCRGGAESGTVSEVNARTEVTPVASTIGYGGRLSNSYFDMTGKRIYAKVSNVTSLPSGQEVYIGFGWGGQKGYNAVVQLGTNVFVFQGNVDSFGNASGVFSDGMWLGLRHNAADDTMHVETAPAAEDPPVTWTDQASQARDQRAPLKAVLLGFGSGCFNLAVGTPLVVQFDGFNTATTSGTSIALTGQSLSGAVGAILAASSLALSGGGLSSSQGTIQQGAPITGQSVVAAHGSPSGTTSVALTGQALSVGQGTVSASVPTSAALTGQLANVAQGSAALVTSVALTGQSLTAARGTTTATTSLSVTGQGISGAAGSVSPIMSLGLSGQSLTAARGTIVASLSPALTGQGVMAAQGSTLASSSLALTGGALTVARGIVTVAGASNVTAALTGQGVTSAQGILAPAMSLGIAGQQTVSAQSSVSLAPRSIALSGQGVTSVQGTATAAFGPVLAGQSASIGFGTITLGISPAMAGQALAVAQNDLTTHPPRQYPLAGIAQPYPGAPQTYDALPAQSYPIKSAQTYPLEGVSQNYPLTGTG